MRVIAGTRRSMPLKAPVGMDTRTELKKHFLMFYRMKYRELNSLIYLQEAVLYQ